MSDSTNRRKLEHISLFSTDPGVDRRADAFAAVHLTHRALPELDLADVDPRCTFLGKTLRFPLLISSMTGGDHEQVLTVNRNLALAAEATGVAMAVGSQRVQFTHPAARASFQLRGLAPTTVLLANLGAVQLNKGFGPAECQEAVDTLGADGLYLHLNPLQEAIQPEGDTCFASLAARIGQVARTLKVPVLVKEIGCGLSLPDARLLFDQGIRTLDVAGAGGTSWSRIEHHRRQETFPDELGLLFQDWGIPTPQALLQLAPLREQGVTLVASGGVRSALDMVKAAVLGARLSGLAAPFLAPARESADAVIRVIRNLEEAFRIAMWLLGMKNLEQVEGNRTLLRCPLDIGV